MVKINMISVKKLIEYISMESIIKKRIVIRLDENKSLTEIPEGIVEQKCFYKINYYVCIVLIGVGTDCCVTRFQTEKC